MENKGKYSYIIVGAGAAGSLVYANGSTDYFEINDGTNETFRIACNGFVSWNGVTSASPALKRSSATLEARLADDTGYCGFTAGLITATVYKAKIGRAHV